MSENRRGLSLLARNLRNLINAPHAIRAVEARYGKGTAQRSALRRIVFFPGLGIACNRVKKNANTALVLLLQEMQTGRSDHQAETAKDEAPNLFDLPRAEQARIGRYAVITSVRNPYSRLLSAFLDKFRFDEYRRKHGEFSLTPEGFDTFIGWLEAGGLRKDAHWDLQTRLLALPLDRYDAVLRFEHLRDDMAAFLASRGLTMPPGALQGEHRGDKGKETRARDQIATFYTPERAARVQRLFQADFDALGYDTALPKT